jgi:hypothetical protein
MWRQRILRLARPLSVVGATAGAGTTAALGASPPHTATDVFAEIPMDHFAAEALAMESPFHRRDAELINRGRAERPGSVSKRHTPTQTHVVRIVLTGGPCAGKSSAMAHLIKSATAEGFDVVTAPETATMMFNSGLSFPTDEGAADYEDKAFLFQQSLIRLQLQMERSLTTVAASTGRPTIVVFDRGLLDAKGYMSAGMWQRVLDSMDDGGVAGTGRGVTEAYCLKRYDGVLHLTTAADGAAAYYKHGMVTDDSGSKVFRRETPKEAIDLDRKMQVAWAAHPRHLVIPNADSFREKVEAATAAVLKVARDTHPQQWRAAHARGARGGSAK